MLNDNKPVITWGEILTRARDNIIAEALVLERTARESGLPLDCYSADRECLEAKRMAIDILIQTTNAEQ